MTKAQAVELARSEWWKEKTDLEVVRFQLYEERVCMPFGDFQLAVGRVLKRPVWDVEFANPERLQREFERKYPDNGIGSR